MDGDTRRIVRIAIDAVCLAIAGIPSIYFRYANIQPFQRGFYCDDESIMKPYKTSTVSWDLTIALSVMIPTMFIFLVEGASYLGNSNRQVLPSFTIRGITFNNCFWMIYKYAGMFYFGLAVTMSFKVIGNFIIGRPRPHFLAVCQPDFESLNCTGWMKYIEGDVCRGPDPQIIKEARLSFPSGHSTLSFFAGTYAVMYLQSRMTWRGSILVRHLLQAICFLLSFCCALSRISDYVHHWSDVLAGSFLGIFFAAVTVYWCTDLFGSTPISPHHKKSNGEMTSVKMANVEKEPRDTSTVPYDQI